LNGLIARVPRLDGLELIFVCHCLFQAVAHHPGHLPPNKGTSALRHMIEVAIISGKRHFVGLSRNRKRFDGIYSIQNM
jgi:hypothetical protein